MIVLRLLVALCITSQASAAVPATLELQGKVPLGDVRGRIDHLAIDVSRQRLYVAELGNDSVGVLDLKARKMIRTLAGFKAPQGIGYVPSSDDVYIANAGDGTVRIFHGESLTPAGQIALGEDADNVRVDDAHHRVYIGYGDGALAVIDSSSRKKRADIALPAHPESFQIESSGSQLLVNLPDAREIAVVDAAALRQVATWPTGELRANFPLALDQSRGRALVVFRHPATLGVYRQSDGKRLNTTDTCGDADDVFFDSDRSRIYVSCGEGFLDVLTVRDDHYERLDRIATSAGARTSFFVSQLGQFLLAVRASGSNPAAIWIFAVR